MTILNDVELNDVEKWLNELANSPERKDANGDWIKWTATKKNKDIKKLFAEKIKMPTGYHAHYTDKSEKSSEFMYDFSWVRRVDDYVTDVALVMELEFSDTKTRKGIKGGLRFDLNKILQADAPLKVFGFQCGSTDTYNTIIDDLNESVKQYQHRVESRLLIFGWTWKDSKENGEHRFLFNQHELKVSNRS